MEKARTRTAPPAGKILRPSDGQSRSRTSPLCQFAGSRGRELSRILAHNICCMASLKQTLYLRGAEPRNPQNIFYIRITDAQAVREILTGELRMIPKVTLVKGKLQSRQVRLRHVIVEAKTCYRRKSRDQGREWLYSPPHGTGIEDSRCVFIPMRVSPFGSGECSRPGAARTRSMWPNRSRTPQVRRFKALQIGEGEVSQHGKKYALYICTGSPIGESVNVEKCSTLAKNALKVRFIKKPLRNSAVKKGVDLIKKTSRPEGRQYADSGGMLCTG